MQHRFTNYTLALLGLSALTLSGCGGGSSSSSPVEALTIADSMSVITVEEVPPPPGSTAPGAQADTSGFASDADYFADSSNSRVYDPSMEALGTVNMILCLLKQTAYSGLLNEGLYKAQIDEASCNQGGNSDSSSTGQSSGADQSFSIWVIESSRTSSTGAQTVEFWVPNDHDGDQGPSQIRVRMDITEGKSESNPFGVFDLNFVQVDTKTDEITGFGNLATLDVLDGFIGFTFYEQHGDIDAVPEPNGHAETVQANVNMFADQSEGVANILQRFRADHGMGDTGIVESTYQIAFDETHVLRATDGATGVCLSRTNFARKAWRYNLYDATTGDRVELNSGFGFQTAGGDYGWVGYYGLWTQPGVDVANGDTVTRQEFGSTSAETYTVLKAPGKLIRNTRHTLSLTDITNERFEWFDFGLPSGIPAPPMRHQIGWDGKSWVVLSTWSDETQMFEDLESPTIIDTFAYMFLGMWSQSLGGSVNYVYGNEFITYFQQANVTPEDEIFSRSDTVDVYGYFQCLNAGITGEQADNGQVYLPVPGAVDSPWHYVFDRTTMALSLVGKGTQTVGLGEGQTISSGPYTWGMRSGPMVSDTTGFEGMNDIWSSEVFYTYETGPNSWNQYATLLDSEGVAVSFDPPLQFTYVHSIDDDANADPAFDGRSFFLNYGGPGNLGGIPQTSIDFNDDGTPDRFLPAFTIKDGTLCGPTGVEYVIRAIDSEYTLAPADGECGLLSVDTVGDLTLPTAEDWTDPDMGSMPVVEDAPRVIEGVIIETSGL